MNDARARISQKACNRHTRMENRGKGKMHRSSQCRQHGQSLSSLARSVWLVSRRMCLPHFTAFGNSRIRKCDNKQSSSQARKLVGHFSHLFEQKQSSTRFRSATSDCSRNFSKACRRDSSYLMLGRLVQEKLSVHTVLEDEATTFAQDRDRLRLSGGQLDMAEEVVESLQPLQVATTALSEESNTSI